MNNVFAIPKPEYCECMVHAYQWGHSTLTLKVIRQQSPEIQYIRFTGVEYFAGPLHWTGANFIQRPTSECLEMLQKAERATEFVTESDLRERSIRLLIVELTAMPVQIICHQANRYSG